MQLRDLLAELVCKHPAPFYKGSVEVALAGKWENESIVVMKWKGDIVYPVVQLHSKNSLYQRCRQSVIQVLRVKLY